MKTSIFFRLGAVKCCVDLTANLPDTRCAPDRIIDEQKNPLGDVGPTATPTGLGAREVFEDSKSPETLFALHDELFLIAEIGSHAGCNSPRTFDKHGESRMP